jgi:hypothetical protein
MAKTMSFSAEEKEYKLIKDYCKENSINMSKMTEKLWLEHIKKIQKNEKK